ncbi:MAG: glycosyltransferase family 4 protein [Acidimicrobiia bacterium]
MRVAMHAGQLLQPVPGGIGRYVRELLARLASAGAEPIAFAAGARPRNVPAPVPWIDLGRPAGSMRYELWHRTRHPIVRLDVDVVHAPSLAVPPVRDAPLAVTVHDIAFLRVPGSTTRRGVSFHHRALDIARRDAALVLAPSNFSREDLIREGFPPDDIVVAPLGVNRPPPRDPDEIDAAVARAGLRAPYLLTVGTVEPRKDLPTITAALQRLRSREPDLELAVVGPRGWGEVEGLDRAGVRVLGPQPWPVVDALYRRAACCCIASRYEGFGLPALEALSCGTPVVAADDSSLTELVGDAGLLFPPGDVDALTVAVERVLADSALRAQLQRRGRARASTLTWEASATAHVEAFGRALDRYRQRV